MTKCEQYYDGNGYKGTGRNKERDPNSAMERHEVLS